MNETVRDNPAENRFELSVDGELAVAEYERDGDTLVFTHTRVPPTIGRRGVGSELVRGALEEARTRGLTIVARCSFVAAFVQKHPEYQDLVVESR